LVPILSRTNPVHTAPAYLYEIHYQLTYVLVFLVVFFLLPVLSITYMQASSPRSCYMPFSSHLLWLHHSNYIWRRVQVMKLLIMKLSAASWHFISPRSKCSPNSH
jgi:hypothetical protein